MVPVSSKPPHRFLGKLIRAVVVRALRYGSRCDLMLQLRERLHESLGALMLGYYCVSIETDR
jgi:hypothetical protein